MLSTTFLECLESFFLIQMLDVPARNEALLLFSILVSETLAAVITVFWSLESYWAQWRLILGQRF